MKKTILFICTHNSARSQIAEGIVNHLFGDKLLAFSAGTIKSHVNPYAVKTMAEIGIDITDQFSKSIEDFRDKNFDYVITVCDNARETCPFFPNSTVNLHKSFEDPSFEQDKYSDEEIQEKFRQAREKIKIWIEEYFNNL